MGALISPADGKPHFTINMFSGVVAAGMGAAVQIGAFRWTSTTKLAIIKHLHFQAVCAGTAFTAGPALFGLRRGSAWTVAPSAGTGLTPAAMFKHDSTMASTSLAANDARIVSTANTGITIGAVTAEASYMGLLMGAAPSAVGTMPNVMVDGPLFDERHNGECILRANEGLIIYAVSVPATGTWSCRWMCAFQEADV